MTALRALQAGALARLDFYGAGDRGDVVAPSDREDHATPVGTSRALRFIGVLNALNAVDRETSLMLKGVEGTASEDTSAHLRRLEEVRIVRRLPVERATSAEPGLLLPRLTRGRRNAEEREYYPPHDLEANA
jgi:hypothetical protein